MAAYWVAAFAGTTVVGVARALRPPHELGSSISGWGRAKASS